MRKEGFKFCFILTFIFSILLECLFVNTSFASMSSYCAVPPFVGATVKPNVMVILDNSGSMLNFAYDYHGSSTSTGFDPNKSYYGYFDSESWYKYVSNQFVATAKKSDRGKLSNEWDGNFLNWLTMRRIDIARKVLVGGKTTSRMGSGNPHTLVGEGRDSSYRGYKKKVSNASLYTPFSNVYYFYFYSGNISKFRVYKPGTDYTYYVKVKVDDEPKGIIQKVGDKVRWGLTFYHYTEGGYIAEEVGSNINSIVADIENTRPSTWTPLAETLWMVTGYFAQKTSSSSMPNVGSGPGPRYHSGDYQVGKSHDPYNFGTGGSPKWASCAKSFVILITDGEPTQDTSIPYTLRDYDNDGNDPGSYPSNGTDYLDDVALYAHTTDLRPDDEEINGVKLEDMQNITLYTVFAFGSNSQLLKDAAKNGGFTDKNGNGIPDLQSEWDEDGDGVPDTYFEAPSGYEMESALTEAITNILKFASSGTACSVLSTSVRGSAYMSQAYFLPQFTTKSGETVHWAGYLKGFWVDKYGSIREDTDPSHDASGTNVKAQLELDKDKIMVFKPGGTGIDLFSSNSKGKAISPCSPDTSIELADTKTIWDASLLLWERTPSSRTIYTSIDGKNLIDFTVSNASSLNDFLRTYKGPSGTDTQDAENLISYIRGEDTDICLDSDDGTCTDLGHRKRELTRSGTKHIWKLGDIVYSNPRMLSHFALGTYDIRYQDTTYTKFTTDKVCDWKNNIIKRHDYLFVGANDGMLHAFYIGDIKEKESTHSKPGLQATLEDPKSLSPGKEVWAYIPMNLLPYLKYLAFPDYCHIFYVDQRTNIFDASIDGAPTDTKTKNSWRTILLGGLRFGGAPSLSDVPSDSPCIDSDGNIVSCSTSGARKIGLSSIYALDITDPESPSLLFEFSDPNLGFTTSYPAIVRIGPKDKNGYWYVVFGSGPTDYEGDVPPSPGYLYVVDLRTGSLVGKLNLGADTYVGDCLAADLDNDYSVDAIYFGVVKKSGSSLSGAMMRVVTNEQTPVVDGSGFITNWTVTTLCEAYAPVTASCELAIDEQGSLWVYFGTGKYFGDSDKTDTTQNYLYGVRDKCWVYNPSSGKWRYDSSCLSSPITNLYDATNLYVEGVEKDYICMCEAGEVEKDPSNPSGCPSGSDKVITEVTNPIVKKGTPPPSSPPTIPSSGLSWDNFVTQLTNLYATGTYSGWKISLFSDGSSPSERVISKPAVVGQLAMFTTFTPNADICGFGGTTNLFSIYYKAGIPYKQPSIYAEWGTEEWGGKLRISRSSHARKNEQGKELGLGKGAPPTGEGIVTKRVGGKLETYIQLSTGQVVKITQKPIFMTSNVQFWIER